MNINYSKLSIYVSLIFLTVLTGLIFSWSQFIPHENAVTVNASLSALLLIYAGFALTSINRNSTVEQNDHNQRVIEIMHESMIYLQDDKSENRELSLENIDEEELQNFDDIDFLIAMNKSDSPANHPQI